ncbi:ATP-dependent helicase HrpB [Corynebacterium sp. TAE3-ERU12]|uniref:ATP-dependent helicase HrpB n=1 Tax=Corynebacterium sp. TAE3-ERU12 TaxID=2849491 RepID=UPI001C440016|nr:ATP-dependent helicase HrpB [Corynebacterium sp. TAE3-ERU12]MBV7294381.1 ATP-dependent helicase HrpB [Corynebacterium sp. TAE3-ERU12]
MNAPAATAPFDIATIGAGLPFAAAAEQLAHALGTVGASAVVQAPPGTGKTTLVPPIVANGLAQAGVSGRVVVTAPRRVAVRAAARRLAELADVELGREVGYTVRGDARTCAATRVEFCTPGVLVRRLLADAELAGVAAVVLDEVHERGLDTDIALAMVRDLRDLREDLQIVAMSATVDAPRFAALLGDAPIIEAPAVLHELDIRYAPPSGPALGARGVEYAFVDHVATEAAKLSDELAAAYGDEADVLVFAPGVREVDRIVGTLEQSCPEVEVLALHGRLGPADQDRVVAGRGRRGRRIIVATSIAESSLTVPHVRGVVDACLARGPRMDRARGMSGLVTTSCARSSAEQRSGRAARLGPGVAVRCISQSQWPQLDAWPAPEIAVADLTQAMLDVAVWGTPGGVGLRLLDAPPPAHVQIAHRTLSSLGALADGGVTDFGRILAALPVYPRAGRALLLAAPVVGARAAAEATAVLTDSPSGDLTRGVLSQSAKREARRLERLAGQHAVAAALPDPPAADPSALVTALAWPDRIARCRNRDTGDYLTVGGTAATAPPELRGHEWLAIGEVTRAAGAAGGRAGAVIRAAAPASVELAQWAAASLCTEDREVRFSGVLGQGRVTARRVRRIGAIELAAQPVTASASECEAAVLAALADDQGVLVLTEEAERLRARMALLHEYVGAPWPDVSTAALADEAAVLLAGSGSSSPRAVGVDQLQRLLPWPEAARLDELVPQRLTVPSGSRVPVTYCPGEPPKLEVKLQECFGLADTPTVADGRVQVVLHLLSPARRPLAVTSDLRSFWDGPYAQVRAEMRGRYPKHPWPEDPWSAPATKRTNRRT